MTFDPDPSVGLPIALAMPAKYRPITHPITAVALKPILPLSRAQINNSGLALFRSLVGPERALLAGVKVWTTDVGRAEENNVNHFRPRVNLRTRLCGFETEWQRHLPLMVSFTKIRTAKVHSCSLRPATLHSSNNALNSDSHW
jgi:hypothetical protein